jgi:ribosome maturation protein Sdo1
LGFSRPPCMLSTTSTIPSRPKNPAWWPSGVSTRMKTRERASMSKPSRSDARLLIRALRQGWNIPVKKRSQVVKVLTDILSNKEATVREKTSAARALMQASRVELDAIRIAQGAQYDNLTQRVEALETGGVSVGQLAPTAGGH